MPPANRRQSPSQMSAYKLLDQFLNRHGITVYKDKKEWLYTNTEERYPSKNAAYIAALNHFSFVHKQYEQAYIDRLVE